MKYNQCRGHAKNHIRPRVHADGVTPISEYDCRLMAVAGNADQAAILAEFEDSHYFRVVPFATWRDYFRTK